MIHPIRNRNLRFRAGLSLVLGLGLVLAMAAAGCRASTGQPPVSTTIPSSTPPTKTAVETTPASTPLGPAARIDRSSQLLDTLNGYYLDRSIKYSKSMAADSSGPTISTVVSQQVLDLKNHSMRMDNTINVKVPSGQPSWPLLANSVYIIGDEMYIQGLFPDKLNAWSKTPVTSEYWLAQNQAFQLIRILKLSSVTMLPDESVSRGNTAIMCTVLQANPARSLIWDLVVAQPGIQLPPGAPPGVSFDQIMQSADLKLWLDSNALLPVKAEVSTHIQITPEQLPSLSSKVDMDITLLFSFHDYNGDLPVTLPDEAKTASELNLHKLEPTLSASATTVPSTTPAP